MRISDAELDFWGDFFHEHQLKRYLKFSTFIHAPRLHIQRIFGGEYRPLTARQEEVRKRLVELGRYDMIERMEARGDLLTKPATATAVDNTASARICRFVQPTPWKTGGAA